MKNRDLIKIFEKVNKVTINENASIKHNLNEGDVVLNPKGQAILKAMDSMAERYVNKFIGEIMNIDSNWKTLTIYKDRIADILSKSPVDKYANILANYPDISAAVKKI